LPIGRGCPRHRADYPVLADGVLVLSTSTAAATRAAFRKLARRLRPRSRPLLHFAAAQHKHWL